MKVLKAFIRQSFQATSIYKFEFWMQILMVYIQMYAMSSIWHILYQQNPAAVGTSLDNMITYSILGAGFLVLIGPGRGVQWYISNQMRTGAIDIDLIKPLDFFLHMLYRNVGEFLVRFFIMFVPAITLAFIFLGFKLPEGILAGVAFIPSFVFAYLIQFCLSFILGLLSVLTLDIRSVSWAYNAMIMFLSGQMVPLWLFPQAIGRVVAWLPFKGMFYIPISIYIGKDTGASLLFSLLFQAIWVCVLVVLARLAWKAVYKKLVVQGG